MHQPAGRHQQWGLLVVVMPALAMATRLGQWGFMMVAVVVVKLAVTVLATATHRNICASSPCSSLPISHSEPRSPALAPPWPSPAAINGGNCSQDSMGSEHEAP
jgi:hypothetical protein